MELNTFIKIYIIGYLIGTFILTIPHDSKFPNYIHRIKVSAIFMMIWPIILILIPIHYWFVERN